MNYVYFNIVFYVNEEYCYANSKANKLYAYYKNMINLFQTAKINSYKNNIKLTIFTNRNVPNKFISEFNELEVEVIIRENQHIPPKGYSDMWQGTFFYLDSVSYFKDIMKENDILIMIDPDCLITKDITPVIDIIKRDKVVNYKVEYPFEYLQNGLSRKEMAKIILEENENEVKPVFFGGEFYGFLGEKIVNLSEELELAYKISLNRFKNKKEYFKTEEHIFTYVFYKLNYISGSSNEFLKRIWTSPDFNNVQNDDRRYIIWHLPAEKNRGLIKIYNRIFSNRENVEKIRKEELQEKFGKILGIPQRGIIRYSYDKIYSITKQLLKK